MQAWSLAGGEGTRLRPLTSTIPKPVVPIVGRPFISYMIEWLRGHGVEEVILACGFMAADVRAVIGDGSRLGVRVDYVEEPEPLGTGGALKYAQELLAKRFLMLNGDVLTDIDLRAQLAQHERTRARATLALVPVEDPSAYGLVLCDADGSVEQFIEKPRPGEAPTNLISAGAYVLEREVLEHMERGAASLEVGPAAAQGRVHGHGWTAPVRPGLLDGHRQRQSGRSPGGDTADLLDVSLGVAAMAAGQALRLGKAVAALPHAQRRLGDPGPFHHLAHPIAGLTTWHEQSV